jgi:hypothetical protein
MKQYRYNTIKIVVMINMGLLALMGCTKEKETPIPMVYPSQLVTVDTDYYNSTFVGSNMVGKWAVYKHTHATHDSVYEVYLQVTDIMIYTHTNVTFNFNPIESYIYNAYDIQSANHHYYVEDMNEDKDWMYLYTYTPSYVQGFDTLYLSCTRVP